MDRIVGRFRYVKFTIFDCFQNIYFDSLDRSFFCIVNMFLILYLHFSFIFDSGMAPGCLVGGYVMQKYGRKFVHYFLCVPTVLGWFAIMSGQNVAVLLLGRFLTGEQVECQCSIYQ